MEQTKPNEVVEKKETVKIEETRKYNVSDGVAKIKKEYLMMTEKIGEKRKLDTTTEKVVPKNEKTGQNHGRRKKNKILKSDFNDGETQKPQLEDEFNDIPLEMVRTLSRNKYPFLAHDEVLKRVNDYANEHNKFKNNIIKQLNHEVFPDMEDTKYRPKEIKKIDWKGKTVLAPLTTVGNLPFRRICKDFGVDVTVGEMAVTYNILKGKRSELSLLRRHKSEDIFGIQVAGSSPSEMIKLAEFVNNELKVDFVDINCGCPIDAMCSKGMGSGLMERQAKLQNICRGMKQVLNVPLTVKMRTGMATTKPFAHQLFPALEKCGVDALTLHGRSKKQRYTKLSDWDYIEQCAKTVNIPVIGNGDILSFEDFDNHLKNSSVDGMMIGRGALIKPWIFKEIKERKHYDISSSERLDILKDFVNYGIEHWGSDEYGLQITRKFTLEWISFLYRYIPVGLLEVLPQKINERPPPFFGRNDLETLMASPRVEDWIKITELLPLGKTPDNFTFIPKHKSNSYDDGSSNVEG
eukprot:gene4969-8563_t